MAEHDHEDDAEHEHGVLHFESSEATDGALAQVRATNAPLADVLELTAKWAQLTEEERQRAPELQTAVEKHAGWIPGYHAEGDRCATCGMPTLPVFTDRFQEGELPYAAFLRGLPVHATQACLDGFAAKRPDTSPRGVDKARRELARDLERPSPRMSQFFRHDLLAHPPFALEDWANSVAEAQQEGLGKNAMKDIERLIRWVHGRLFHHH